MDLPRTRVSPSKPMDRYCSGSGRRRSGRHRNDLYAGDRRRAWTAVRSIRVLHGSTGLVSDGSGSYHSRTAIMGGSAILDAADKLRPLIREAGRDGSAARRRTSSSETAASSLPAIAPLRSLTSAHARSRRPSALRRSTFAKARTPVERAQAAHVAVDPRTPRGGRGLSRGRGRRPPDQSADRSRQTIAHSSRPGGVFLDHVIYDANDRC